jgi:ribose transport system substrate-binding protein
MRKENLGKGRGWRFRLATAGAAAGLVSATLLAGAAGPAATAASAATKHYTFLLIPGLTIDPFYITMHNGAAVEAAKLGVTLKWAGATVFLDTDQIPVVNSELASKPDALLIAPTDDVATLKNTSILTAAISSDNYQGGEAAADTIAKLAHDKGDVAVINVNKGVSTTDLRQAGFLAEMKKYPNMQVVATEYDQDSLTTAESDARSLILAHPDLVGIFGTNLYSAQGAGQGVIAAGDKGKIFVSGYDAEPAEITLLRKGVINILVIQNPAEEGALAVQYAYDAVTGKKAAIVKSTLLANVVATQANMNDPSISKYFYNTKLS